MWPICMLRIKGNELKHSFCCEKINRFFRSHWKHSLSREGLGRCLSGQSKNIRSDPTTHVNAWWAHWPVGNPRAWGSSGQSVITQHIIVNWDCFRSTQLASHSVINVIPYYKPRRKPTIAFIDAEKSSEKIKNIFIIKLSWKLGVNGTFLSVVTDICKRPVDHVVLHSSTARQGCLLSPFLFYTETEVLVQY